MDRIPFSLFAVILLCQNFVSAQFYFNPKEVDESTSKLVHKLVEIHQINYYDYMGVNIDSFGDSLSEDDMLFKKISLIDLEYLFHHPHPYLRAYAYNYFFKKEKLDINYCYKIISNNLTDTVIIDAGTSCLHGRERISDIMISNFESYFSSDTHQKYYLEKYDSIILYTMSDFPSFAKARAVQNVAGREEYYTLIKKLVLENYPYAIPALASFRNESDINLILDTKAKLDPYEDLEFVEFDYRNPILKAVELFPNNGFNDFVYECYLEYKRGTSTLYLDRLTNAIASMKDKRSLLLLEDLYNNAQNDTINCIYTAANKRFTIYESLLKFYCPEYDDFVLSILRDKHWLNDAIYNIFSDRLTDEINEISKSILRKALTMKYDLSEIDSLYGSAIIFHDGLQKSIDNLIKQDFSFLDSIFQTSITIENSAIFIHILSTYLSNNISYDKNKVLERIKSDLDKRTISLFEIHHYLYNRNEDFDKLVLPYLKSNFGQDTYYYLFKN